MTIRILRTPEAAKYIGLSASTLAKFRLSGDGPKFIKLGKRAIGYDQQDLDSWLEGRAKKSTSEVSKVSDNGEEFSISYL